MFLTKILSDLCAFSDPFIPMLYNLRDYLLQPSFRSVGAVFAIHAVFFSLWVTRLPEIKEDLALSEGELGLVLFFLPLGALVAMLVAGRMIHLWGAGNVTTATTVIFALVMPLPLLATNVYILGAALFAAGLVSGAMDIAMNAVAAALEDLHRKVIMATTHGFFSLGGMVGALLGSVFLGLEWVRWAPMIGAAVICFLVLIPIHREIGHIRDKKQAHKGGHFSLPGRAVLGLALIGLFCMMGEGAVADWSAVYLKEVSLADPYMVGLGYAGFSLAMTLGRFNGDVIIHRFGGLKIIIAGGFFTLIGLALVLIGAPLSTILGFTFVGLGYSCIIPVVFSEAAKSDPVSAARGITAVASLSYMGFLAGPVIIGLVSEQGGLKTGMIFLMVTALLSVLIATRSVRKRTMTASGQT